jgi:hypothetical protein
MDVCIYTVYDRFSNEFAESCRGHFEGFMTRTIKGRGAAVQPANPYLPVDCEADLEQVAGDKEYLAALTRPHTEYFPDE